MYTINMFQYVIINSMNTNSLAVPAPIRIPLYTNHIRNGYEHLTEFGMNIHIITILILFEQ